VLIVEVVLVLALSLGRSAVYSVVDLISALLAAEPLSSQQAVLNGSLAPGRPWLDLTLQVLGIAFRLTPVLLVGYLLWRTGDDVRRLFLGPDRRGRYGGDVVRGALLALGVGSVGIGFYLFTRELGVNLTVVAEDLPGTWWRYPLLVASAAQNALLEECVVVVYLLTRLRQIGLSPRASLLVSAGLRGSYHLYQGFGGFVGNAVMGLLFGWLYQRWGRVVPLVAAHTFLDIGAFLGYAILADRVSWL